MKSYDIDSCKIDASKHFVLDYMKKWDWDYTDLRSAIREAHKTEKVGKKKFEAYVRKGGDSKKIIFVYYEEFDTIFVISGSEGAKK